MEERKNLCIKKKGVVTIMVTTTNHLTRTGTHGSIFFTPKKKIIPRPHQRR